MRKPTRVLTNKSYDSYVRGIKNKREVFERHGNSLYVDIILTREQFEQTYYATRRMLEQEVMEGKRKAVGNVTQYMVSRQAYQFSAEQARGIKGNELVVMPSGQEYSTPKIRDIRTGKVDIDWEFVRMEKEYWKEHPEAFKDLSGRMNYRGVEFRNSRGGTGVENDKDFNEYISWFLFNSEV